MAASSGENLSGSERRGIPAAQFVEDVHSFMAGREAEVVMRPMQEQYQQYKLLESKLQVRSASLRGKIPDIRRSIQVVEALEAKQSGGEEAKVDFELADGVYAQASVQGTDSVCLWLGANVMVEYSFSEAASLLQTQLLNATESLTAITEDLQFIRDQVTITEVTMARVYNHEVKLKRERRLAGSSEDAS